MMARYSRVFLCSMLCVLFVLITVPGFAGTGRGDWWMFHHDPQHTGRSAFSGPTVPGLRWAFYVGGGFVSSPAIGADGTIYLGAEDGKLYAVNADGTQQWAFAMNDAADYSSPAIGSDGTIYVGSLDCCLYAVNPDGTQQWLFPTLGIIESSPVIGADGTIYIGSSDGLLYAINPDGTEKWAFTAGGSIESFPALGTDGTIYVGADDGKLYAINPDGTQKWAFTTGGYIWSSPAVGTDGTIYVGSEDGKLYAVNADGTQQWTFATQNGIESSPALGSDGTIYVGSDDGCLYAINANGTQQWASTLGGRVIASPAVGNDGTVYVGTENGRLYALQPDGTALWTVPIGSTLYSSPAIGADGTVYTASVDGNLCAIENATAPMLVLTKFADLDNALPGDTVTYTISYTNIGTAASGVVLTDVLPPHVHYVTDSATDSVSYQAGTLTWMLDDIPALGSGQVSFQVTVDDDAPVGLITNTAAVAWDGMPAPVTSNPATVAVALPTYTITPAAGNNGAIDPDTAQQVTAGDNLTFTATPDAGYTVDTWQVDGQPVQTGGITFTLTAISADHQVTVTFKALTFTITPSVLGYGAVSPNTPQTVNYGSTLTFTATPKSGYVVKNWSLDGSPAQTGGAQFMLTGIAAAHTVQVSFAKSVVITPSAGPNGAISPNTAQVVLTGDSLTFTATPNAGYTVDKWSVDGVTKQTNGEQFTLANISAKHSVKVTFAKTYHLTAIADANGQVTPCTSCSIKAGSTVTYTAIPSTGYAVDRWLVDGVLKQKGGATFKLSTIKADHTVEVSFTVATFIVTPSAGTGGKVSPTVTTIVCYGNQLTLTATPSSGYAVGAWTVNGVVAQNGGAQLTLTGIIANLKVQVTFVKLYTITPLAGVNGAISPALAQTVPAGASLTFTAMPTAGFAVDKWYVDGVAKQTGGLQFTLAKIAAKHSVKVTFK